MNLSRRGFLSGIIAACAAPAIIRTAGLIMPIKPTFVRGPYLTEQILLDFNEQLHAALARTQQEIANNMFRYGNADAESRYAWERTIREGEKLLGLKQEGTIISFGRRT